MKRIALNKNQRRILQYLSPRKERAVPAEEIGEYLIGNGYVSDFKIQDIEEGMDYLTDVGYVSSVIVGKGEEAVPKYYLSNTLLVGGKTKQKRLQGKGVVNNLEKIIRRIIGMIFLVSGIGLSFYEGGNMTGAIIGAHTSGFFVGVLFIFIAFILFVFNPEKI